MGMLTGAWREVEPNEKNGNFASYYASRRKVWQKSIDRLIKDFSSGE